MELVTAELTVVSDILRRAESGEDAGYFTETPEFLSASEKIDAAKMQASRPPRWRSAPARHHHPRLPSPLTIALRAAIVAELAVVTIAPAFSTIVKSATMAGIRVLNTIAPTVCTNTAIQVSSRAAPPPARKSPVLPA